MRVSALATLFVLLARAAAAQDATTPPAALSCLDAAGAAEAEWNLPKGLLAAIGRVESGRVNPRSGRVEPWPWIINSAGTDRYYLNPRDAIADVTRERAGGTSSMDVGCFQINLFYHPSAFASLAEAFDPLANARYAARFLTSLHAESGSWDQAVARYHSSVPDIGEPYRQRVMASWQGGEPPSGSRALTPFVLAPPSAASASLAPARVTALSDPHVIRVRAAMFAGSPTSRLTADPHVVHVRGRRA